MKGYLKYCNDVLSGKVIAGEYIQLSCQRFKDDLKRDDLIFKPKIVDRAIKFIGILKHYTGKYSGESFKLEPWQQFIVANIIGFYWKDTDTRRFTSSYIEVSRKNGKTAFAAALCLYFLIADGEEGAEVLLAANSKEQAKIAFKMCSTFCKGLDPKKKKLVPFRADIQFQQTNSTLKVLASDDSKLDGFNASFGLVDEYHSAPNSRVRDVIKSSMGMRENPHLCTITTAGFDKSLPCYQLRTVCTEIIKGVKTDDSFFVAIYSLDEGDDWQDEKNWLKCTPNLDITVSKKYLREQVKQTVNNPSDEVGVKTKNLNIWCDVKNVWIPEKYILDSSKHIELNDHRDSFCFCGVDLSMTGDLTCCCFLIPAEDKLLFKVHYYLPEAVLTGDNKNRELYREWARMGYLIITPGNVTDYDYITKDILKVSEILCIQKIFYDKWNATSWAIDCTNEGLPLEPFGQNIGNFNSPTKEMERLTLGGMVIIDDNPINRFCFRNVTLKLDYNGNCKPDKSNRYNKVDGVIAMLEALGGYSLQPQYNNEIMSM
ncbi:terminase large subunit [Phocaeicola paurosaccharolyticus]|uniref:terminase large subunit n=1 Tax=Phocaeicola paurosaccharolyticus TaxID=732242 RepID=UPI00046899FE|nr:terminase TerL endonuclease subunit [Phocaeicola paurosaccharolyticus]